MNNSLMLSDLAKALRRVCASDLLGQSETTVLVALLLHADGNGNCYPSLDRLARFSKVHRSTVVRILEKLRLVGLVHWQPGGGRSRSNEYHVEIDELLTLPETVAPCDSLENPPETPVNCGIPVENRPEPVGNSRTMHNKPSHDARETVAPCDTNGIIERDQVNGSYHRRGSEEPPAAPVGAPSPPSNGQRATGNGERATGIAERATGIAERATENGTGNAERGTERVGASFDERRNPGGSRGSELLAADRTNGTGTNLPDVWEWLTLLTHLQPTPPVFMIVRQARERAAILAEGKGRTLNRVRSLEVERFVLEQLASICGLRGMSQFAESSENEVFDELRLNFGIPPMITGGGKATPHGR